MADQSESLNTESHVVGTSDQMLFSYQIGHESIASGQFSTQASFGSESTRRDKEATDAPSVDKSVTSWQAAILSTLTSLAVVLVLLVAVRFLLPPMLESARYGWYRGQLRAAHDAAGERLQAVSLDGLSKISEAVSMRVAPSVVHIDVRQNIALVNSSPETSLQALLEHDRVSRDSLAQGSGVIVDAEGYILTNHHVVENADVIEVALSDRRRVRANLIGTDVLTDLALLKIEADGLVPIHWGDSEELTVGSSVWAVGSPFGLTGSVTFGIISSTHRINLRDTAYKTDGQGGFRPSYGDLLQSDVAVNPGNSGGPLVDYHGNLVGINTAILGESYRGISFSIPSRVAKHCYEQLRAMGKVDRGWMGVELAMSSGFGSSLSEVSSSDEVVKPSSREIGGALVQGFASGRSSPALLAGLRIGDRIVEFNGCKVSDSDELMGQIGKTSAGATVPVRVMRGEKLLDLSVTLGTRPAEMAR